MIRRTMLLSRSLATAGAAVTLAVGVAGCGAATTSTSAPGGTTAAAPQAQGGDRTFRDATEFAQWVGPAIKAKKTAKLSITTAATGQSLVMQGQVRYVPTNEMDMTMSGATASKIQIRLVNGVMYLNSGRPVAGKHWVKIDGTGTDPMSRQMAPQLAQLQRQSDPTAALSGATGVPVTSAGTATVDGVQTHHYKLTMTGDQFKRAAAAAGQSLPPSGAPSSATYDYYVDDEGLPRTVDVTTDANGTPVKVTVKMTDFGAPVTIEAPDPADTTTPDHLG